MTKAKAITNDIVENINTQKILFRILIASSILLFGVYIYLVGSIIFNVIARKSLDKTVIVLKSEVNQLELSYLKTVSSIDKEYAKTQGFVDTQQNIFASRNINHVAVR
jgi:hypothetical protein